jgi:hypothetical protein
MPDPTFFHPGSEFFHPGCRIRIKNLSILTQKLFLSSRIYDPGGSSRITDPDPYFLPITDPGSGSATLYVPVIKIHAPPKELALNKN